MCVNACLCAILSLSFSLGLGDSLLKPPRDLPLNYTHLSRRISILIRWNRVLAKPVRERSKAAASNHCFEREWEGGGMQTTTHTHTSCWWAANTKCPPTTRSPSSLVVLNEILNSVVIREETLSKWDLSSSGYQEIRRLRMWWSAENGYTDICQFSIRRNVICTKYLWIDYKIARKRIVLNTAKGKLSF